MPDSGWEICLRSYIPTPVALRDSGQRHDSDRISRLRSRITALIVEHAACLTTLDVKDFTWLG
jgi:hypothetical protein